MTSTIRDNGEILNSFPPRVQAAIADLEPEQHALLATLTPKSGRIIVRKPQLLENKDARRLDSGLFMPDRQTFLYNEWGLKALVLKPGPNCEEDILPGRWVIISEFSGAPVYITETTPFWIVGDGDVMAVIDEHDEMD